MGVGTINNGGNHAVFLDRDGVVNRAVVRSGRPYPPSSLAELEIVPDAEAALAELKRRRFLLLVVTNQPDVARGTQQRSVVESMHAALRIDLPIDDFFVCYHDDCDACDCRKPSPGLLLRAAANYSIDLVGSFLIGDRWKDIEAGRRAGCRTVWIDYGYSERLPRHPDARVNSLRAAVDWILQQNQKREISCTLCET